VAASAAVDAAAALPGAPIFFADFFAAAFGAAFLAAGFFFAAAGGAIFSATATAFFTAGFATFLTEAFLAADFFWLYAVSCGTRHPTSGMTARAD
jgi:hypothetical protein